MIAALDTPTLAQSLIDLLRQMVPFTYSVTFADHGPDRPVSLHDDFPSGKRSIFVSDYQAGPYLLDPLSLAAVRPWSMRSRQASSIWRPTFQVS